MENNEFIIIVCSMILIGASVLAAYSNILIRLHSRPQVSDEDIKGPAPRKYILLAILLSAISGSSDMFVNAVIPLSVRACFTALSIPVNVILARWVLGENLCLTQIAGVGLTIVGSLIAILSASHENNASASSDWRGMLTHPTAGPFLLIMAILVVASLPQLRSSPHRSVPKLVTLLCCSLVASTASTAANVGCKFVGLSLPRLGLASGEMWAILGILTAISAIQICSMTAFLAQFDVSVAIPMYQVMCGLLLSLTAVLVFAEPVPHVEAYLFGILASFFGLWLVAAHHKPPKLKTDFSPEDQPLVVIHRKEDLELL